MDKSLEHKLEECRHVIIQNVEKGMNNSMVFRYLKEAKIDNQVKKYSLNDKDCSITFEFLTSEQARNFYERANFNDKILTRPFNIHLRLTLSDNEMKKYYFKGLTDKNMRRMFELARTIGFVNIYASYTSAISTGKLKPNGIISFIRKEDISEQEFAELSEKFLEIGVKLSLLKFEQEQGIKCSVILTNFYTGNLDASEKQIHNKAQILAEDLMKQALRDQSLITDVSVEVKRKEVPTSENQYGIKLVTLVRAIVEFQSAQDAIDNFQEIRIAFLSLGEAKAALYFHKAESNSYISLFSSGLVKCNEAWTDKVFENELVECFRQVNKDVVQVNVFPLNFQNKTYVARVYLKSEEAGKDFIADYPLKREFFYKNYKDNSRIKFNINVDDKGMGKIKMMQEKAHLIHNSIKNQAENRRNEERTFMKMPYRQPPIGQMMPPNMGMRPGAYMRLEISAQDIEAKIAKTILQKNKILEITQEPNAQRAVKQTLVPLLKHLLSTRLGLPNSEVSVLVTQILNKNDVGAIIDFFSNPEGNYSQLKH